MRLRNLLLFHPRRTLSRFADEKAARDFARVEEDVRLKRRKKLLADPTPPHEARLAEIARLMGQHG